jgi:hypothetical protein
MQKSVATLHAQLSMLIVEAYHSVPNNVAIGLTTYVPHDWYEASVAVLKIHKAD